MSLLERTIALAHELDLSGAEIAQICAAIKVTPRWYYKVVGGHTKDPGVNNVEALYNALIARKQQAAA